MKNHKRKKYEEKGKKKHTRKIGVGGGYIRVNKIQSLCIRRKAKQ